MTTAPSLAALQPKKDPKVTPPVPTHRRAETEAPEEVSSPELDDRWTHMPCTD